MNRKSHTINYIKWIFRTVYNLLGTIYIIRHRNLIKGYDKHSYRILFKGIEKYPNNVKMHKELATLEMINKNWNNAVTSWRKVFLFDRNLLPSDFAEYAKCLIQIGNAAKAVVILQEGINQFPDDRFIINKILELSKGIFDWESIIVYSELLEDHQNKDNLLLLYDNLVNLYTAYKHMGPYNKAKHTLDKIQNNYPEKNQDIQYYYEEILILNKDWAYAISRFENRGLMESSFEAQINLAMLYKITGENSKFETLFKQIIEDNEDKIKNDPLGYRKVILFDNGESRIEFYKKLGVTDSVIITFDAINMTWDKPSFAFKLLQKRNLDIIAIRKNKPRTYQQDLHQEDFVKTVKPLLVGYRDKMSYGFSLGAYHTLYFASLLDCRILAIAPRLSIHPEYGRKKIIPKFKMEHQLNFPANSQIEPIIVYDPKNALDKNYITNSIIPSFPKAKIVNIPYGGHGIAPYLLKVGQLKSFVYSFLENEIPVYNRKLKIKSPVYFKNLGNECLKHNKTKWALDLAHKSLAIEPAYKEAIKLKLKVLKKTNKLEAARHFAVESINLVPKDLDIRLYLIDIYIELGEFEKAAEEIEESIKKFGKHKSIIKRLRELEKVN